MTSLAALLGVPPDRLRAVIHGLADRGETVATAESLTGGLLVAALTEIPGSSLVVRGGLVTYATDLKAALAGVPHVVLNEHGPVHPDVAMAMAQGARRRCAATIGVGLTGVAGPADQNGRPPGTWFCAVAGPGDALATRRNAEADEGRTRSEVRAAAVRAAIDLLLAISATAP